MNAVDFTVDHYEIQERDGDNGVLICYADGTEAWVPKSFLMSPEEIEDWLLAEGYDDAPIVNCIQDEDEE